MMNNTIGDDHGFSSSPFASTPKDIGEKLDRDGFLRHQESDVQGEVDLVDDDGFVVPPSPSEISHTFERVERAHMFPDVENVSSTEDESFVEFQQYLNNGESDSRKMGTSDPAAQGGDVTEADRFASVHTEDFGPSEHRATTTAGTINQENNGIDAYKKQRVGMRDVFQFGDGPRKYLGLGLGLICAAITGCVYPVMAFVLSSTFSVLSVPTSEEFKDDIRELAYIFLILGAVACVATTCQIALLEISAEEMTYSLKTKWFDALLRQDMAFFDLEDVSGTAMLISTAGSRFKNGVGRKLGEGVQFFFVFIGGFVYAFYSSWSTSLVLLAVVPFMSASILFYLKTIQGQKKISNESYAEAGSIVLMAVSAIRTVYSLNASKLLIAKYGGATERAYRAAASHVALLGLANAAVLGSVMFLRSAVLTLFGSFLLYDQVRNDGCDPSGALGTLNESCEPSGQSVMGALIGITLGAAGIPQISLAIEAFADARSACYPAISVMGRRKSDAGSTTKDDGASRLACSPLVTRLPKYEIDSSSADGKSAASVKGEICFDDVSFAYPSRAELVLEGFSLSLKPGMVVGVVGPSGCGKSTVISLLERFYDPTSGSITIDGIDIKDMNVSSLREQIGYVKQEPRLFATSIAHNIRYGKPDATQEEIEEAARLANAHKFIQSFENGYDTLVGDKGSQISGGQKQRIAIARILVGNPKLLLLDEATSALDSESEVVVQEALDGILRRKEGKMTTLIVAHRLSTIQNVDCIIVVCDGRIVESGRHEVLMKKKGMYYNLVRTQTTNHEMEDEDESETGTDSNHSTNENNTYSSTEVPQCRFRNVHFSYPTRPDSTVFRGLNLTVRKGETLALVGESGGGKSTIVSLLERFYDVTAGTVEFDGVDLKELNVRWLRDQIGLVSQEPVLFNDTIMANIKYGKPDATDEQVHEAAKEANAHNFITSFPQSYDTDVGEGGAQLSGGQKQRIAIARAILKEHSVLLLDEASSALDSESERLVQNALDKIMATKSLTTIVIAHRLSTVRNATRIAVIAKGRVQEVGTWEQLMSKQDGQFRRMSLFQTLDGHKKDAHSILAQVNEETDEGFLKEQDIDTNEQNKDANSSNKKNSKRSRLLAKEDSGLLVVGSLGALFAGVAFPATGVLFGYLIELLYRPVRGCDEAGFPSCESIANDMQTTSFYITFAWIGILCLTTVGNVLLFYGFGTASERMNKRVRDTLFQSLLRQEVAYFDKHNVARIASELQDDVAKLHAFSGEPLRTFILAAASLLIGVVVAFYFMWPVALLALGIIPVLGLSAKIRMGRMKVGAKEDDVSPDKIAIETLVDMRTVASLNIEEIKKKEYSTALKSKQPSFLSGACKSGSTGGFAQLAQFWSMGLLFWWGGYLLSTYPDTWSYRDFLMAMFALLVSISGTALGSSAGTTDKKSAEEAADRIFSLIDRESAIDPLSKSGTKLD